MKSVIFVTIAMLSSLGSAVSRAGDYPHERHGLFIGFNLGAGSADVTIPAAGDTDSEWGLGLNLRLGGALRSNLLLGVEASGFGKDEDPELVLNTIAIAVTYYPGADGLFLRGSVGYARGLYDSGLIYTRINDGISFVGTAGYEWRLTGKFAAGPQVEFAHLDFKGDRSYRMDSANFFKATLAFNWYW